MTERILESLRGELDSNNSAERAYLDLWRMFKNAGLEVEVVDSNENTFPKIKDKKGARAYIPQSALIEIYNEGENSIARELNEFRSKKGGDVFGGLSNQEIKKLIESQLHSSWKERRDFLKMLKRAPLRAALMFPPAIAAQALDQAQSTPHILQGHLKDVIAVPVVSYVIQTGNGISNKRSLFIGVLLAGTEFLQRYDPTNTWTFDPKDIIAYSVGTAAVIGFNEARKVVRRQNQTLESVDTSVS